MDGTEPSKFIEKIVLEILNRPRFWMHQRHLRRIEEFNIASFNARQAAYTFLTQYNGEKFVKAQKANILYNNEEIHLCVHNLIYGIIDNNSDRISDTMVEFIYRRGIFSEITWPATVVKQVDDKQMENHENERKQSKLNTIKPDEAKIITPMHMSNIHMDNDYSPIDVEKTVDVINSNIPWKSYHNLDDDDDQFSSVLSTKENVGSPLDENSQDRHSTSALKRLIISDDRTLHSSHAIDDENHFRSSIHIHINQIKSL
ncbi:unnamed protein product [Rotaria socialis]|uniref:Uncharacterized protein n=1 Tax=Rotaria socialis TaxID=392032 RepID=A0A821LX44_9BILA|nr:unnamed protein product [Rotaria socialis]CAF4688154.1 unnamed protein product [Rotaria socialis]CAF4757651.1 unnamed protein product [Rotaria socialis]